MTTWVQTPEEHAEDFALMARAHEAFNRAYDIVVEDRLKWAAEMTLASPAAMEIEKADARRVLQAVEAAIRYKCGSAEPSARVAYHDTDQDAVKILIPTHRMIWQLMLGGHTKHKRVVGTCEKSGRPIYEGTNQLLAPMSHDEAIAFLIWKDLPPGCNNFQIITTDDLPRIRGDAHKARAFRAAWRLEEAA